MMLRILLLAATSLSAISAQTSPNKDFSRLIDPTTTFEAASVKPYAEGKPLSWSGCQGGPGSGDPARVICQHASLLMLIARSYGVRAQEVAGPAWMDTVYFDIEAKPGPGATKAQVDVMFRNLLAERFKLVLHHENRMLPVYAITVAKAGLKIHESGPLPEAPEEPRAPGSGPKVGEDGFPILSPRNYMGGPVILFRNGKARLLTRECTLATLSSTLSRQLERIVVDETGLTGKYDIVLNWTPDALEMGGRPGQEMADPDANLFAAMEAQAGLKLVGKKASRDALVVDRVEKTATEN